MNHRPRKRFGQNFLIDGGIIAAIVAAIAPAASDTIVEIGPGQGALTGPLLEQIPHLHAIELDRDLCQALAARFPPSRLTLHQGDALRFDFASLPAPLRVVGNLPYNISTPLLFHLAGYAQRCTDMHFMLQDEVVKRMAAAPSTPDYGRLSVMLQYRFHIERVFGVPPESFFPAPKVQSAIVRLKPMAEEAMLQRGVVGDEAALGRIVTAAFTQRRKTLRNALASVISADALGRLGIDPGLRPENLSVTDYVAIANAAAATMPPGP